MVQGTKQIEAYEVWSHITRNGFQMKVEMSDISTISGTHICSNIFMLPICRKYSGPKQM